MVDASHRLLWSDFVKQQHQKKRLPSEMSYIFKPKMLVLVFADSDFSRTQPSNITKWVMF